MGPARDLLMAYEEGSSWRKWDLHVHSPGSHTAAYGNSDEAWHRFLADLAALPPAFGVIGINDYMWVDGYARVLEAHQAGALPQIEAIFPVVELRLDDFVGTTSHLSKVNAHVIFAPGTDPDLIRSQFIGRLATHFTLTDAYKVLQTKWDAVPTREALADLGRLIKETIPESELPRFGSDLAEGFNNWVIALDKVKAAIDHASTFKEAPVLGLGKTEWADIPWNDNTIAAKKNLISESNLLFNAAMSASACHKAIQGLRDAKVNHRLLDCSDAHHFSDSDQKDRIGNCLTWVCADPTLAGLKHALLEYRSRVYVGEKPPLLVREQADPTHFVSRVRITPNDPAVRPRPSFEVDIPLNRGFVAVIGNKGSGKSALLDSIALAANSHTESDFTFLADNRFRNPRNSKAQYYRVQLETADGATVGPVSLASHVDLDSPERVRYLPQSLLESLCNKEPGAPDDAFEAEVRSIIFSHVPEHQRLGCKSLTELLDHRGQALDREIDHRRSALGELNEMIAGFEEDSRPSRVRALKANLAAVTEQIQHHDAAKLPDPVPPDAGSAESMEALAAVEALRGELGQLSTKLAETEETYRQVRVKFDAASNLARDLEVFRSSVETYRSRAATLAAQCGLEVDELVQVVIDAAPVEAIREAASEQLVELDGALGSEGTIAQQRRDLQDRLTESESLLDEPRRRFEQQRHELDAWREARARIVGSPTEEGTEEYLTGQIAEAEALPVRLDELRAKRLETSQQIHTLLLEKVKMYRELYAPVEEFLDKSDLVEHGFSLEFEADLEVGEFTEPFLSNIDRGAAGSFYGVEASALRVRERVKRVRPSNWASVAGFLREHDQDLHFDMRSPSQPPLDCPSDLLRKGSHLSAVYDFLYGLGYLDAEYELRSDGRSITELSPGQKGTILLMFYLLVDQSGRPIALDQPDENLDNHTVHTLLRPAIRSAKANRQVFVVTHSPNLAVVGDADQVIVAASDGKEFRYTSGSIENPTIRDLVVDVLEGTWPAFTDRGKKYSHADLGAPSMELSD
jgi:ABC-type lipoprotein export system ATPase subunit